MWYAILKANHNVPTETSEEATAMRRRKTEAETTETKKRAGSVLHLRTKSIVRRFAGDERALVSTTKSV